MCIYKYMCNDVYATACNLSALINYASEAANRTIHQPLAHRLGRRMSKQKG